MKDFSYKSETVHFWTARDLKSQNKLWNLFHFMNGVKWKITTSYTDRGVVWSHLTSWGTPDIEMAEPRQSFGTTEIRTTGTVFASCMCTYCVINLILLLLCSWWFLPKHTFQFHILVKQIPEMREIHIPAQVHLQTLRFLYLTYSTPQMKVKMWT